MRFISWILTLVVLVAALCFALNNRQAVTLSLWPFGIEVEAPLYFLSLGTLLLGLFLGGVMGWASHMPERREARRLRRTNKNLVDKIEVMKAKLPADDTARLPALPWVKSKMQFWRKPL